MRVCIAEVTSGLEAWKGKHDVEGSGSQEEQGVSKAGKQQVGRHVE